jgi:membrane-associated phospholipid phosphatase
MSEPATVLRRLAAALVPACVAVLLTFVVPPLPLDGGLARAAYWIAEAGDTLGSTILSVLLVLALVRRPGLTPARRVREAVALAAAATLFLGGGAAVNEHGIKPWFGVARPSIVELERAGVLQMGAAEFYALGGKDERTDYLEKRLAGAGDTGPHLDASVRDHWIHMTGYSFPSGHSFASMLLATFFLAMALWLLPPDRARPFFLLLPWAVAVCWSRVILRVHSPVDVSFGALQGIVVGVLAFLLVRALLQSGREHRQTRPV